MASRGWRGAVERSAERRRWEQALIFQYHRASLWLSRGYSCARMLPRSGRGECPSSPWCSPCVGVGRSCIHQPIPPTGSNPACHTTPTPRWNLPTVTPTLYLLIQLILPLLTLYPARIPSSCPPATLRTSRTAMVRGLSDSGSVPFFPFLPATRKLAIIVSSRNMIPNHSVRPRSHSCSRRCPCPCPRQYR